MTYIVRFGHSRTEDSVKEYSTAAEAGLAIDAWVLEPGDRWAYAQSVTAPTVVTSDGKSLLLGDPEMWNLSAIISDVNVAEEKD